MKGSIRRRSKDSWELTIDLGRGASGKRVRKFVSVKGRRADADKQLRNLLAAADKGIPIRVEKILVGQWLDTWMHDYVTAKTRVRTMERYKGAINKHILPRLGHVELARLTPRDIQALQAELLSVGLSTSSVDLVHNILSGALKYAVRMEVLWRNPCQAVSPPQIIRKEVSPPDIPGVQHILEMAKADEHALFPCLHLLAYTGIRRGEALGLRWEDVDLELGVISVAQTLGRANGGLIFQPPKTNAGRRSIDLDAGTVSVLRAHQGQQLLRMMSLDRANADHNLVFSNPLGEPLNPMALTRAFQRLAKRAGITDAKLHDLRHFHASVMLQQNQSPALVSKRLGHASVSTTMDIYSHILPGWQREAADAFAKAMEEG
jgi:integrase